MREVTGSRLAALKEFGRRALRVPPCNNRSYFPRSVERDWLKRHDYVESVRDTSPSSKNRNPQWRLTDAGRQVAAEHGVHEPHYDTAN